MRPRRSISSAWLSVAPKWLPFADAATAEAPLSRLLRLSLFQVSVGLAAALLIGTLNRVMIVELGLSATLVAVMIALPILAAPFRALIGFRSDNHRSHLGWKRVPYIWIGTMLQFGGLAIMPFALIVLSGDADAPEIVGPLAAALAFLLVGAGLHTVQTAGLALATDLVPVERQPKVVALLSLMMLVGMFAGGLVFGVLLAEFSQLRLIQVIQGSAILTMVLNGIALWKQEARDPSRTRHDAPPAYFDTAWRDLTRSEGWRRRLVAVGLGAAAFSMQDVLLEPYGGQVLGMSVGGTTLLTAIFAAGGVVGFALAAARLTKGDDAHRLSALGALAGIAGFALVLFAAPLEERLVFALGTLWVGFGSGLFTVGILTACMRAAKPGQIGLALGAWGAVQATTAGVALAAGGMLRDAIGAAANAGALGEALMHPATGYGAVYLIEVALLFATIIAVGPLVRATAHDTTSLRLPGTAAQPSHT
jgi:BCD family chlorophyll transporter-like MFS transporter